MQFFAAKPMLLQYTRNFNRGNPNGLDPEDIVAILQIEVPFPAIFQNAI